MGPPAYGRTQSQPYQVPLAILERKMERERRQEDSTQQVGYRYLFCEILLRVTGIVRYKSWILLYRTRYASMLTVPALYMY